MKTRIIISLILAVFITCTVAPVVHAAKSDKKAQKQENRKAETTTPVATTTPFMGSTTPVIATTAPTAAPYSLPFSKQTVLYVLYGLSLIIAVVLIAGLFSTMGVLLISIMGAALAVTVVLILIATFTTVLY